MDLPCGSRNEKEYPEAVSSILHASVSPLVNWKVQPSGFRLVLKRWLPKMASLGRVLPLLPGHAGPDAATAVQRLRDGRAQPWTTAQGRQSPGD